jgi:hypothetical protein
MQIRLVNIIPKSRSAETNFDSEPSITVNPANPQQIVITAFTPDTAQPVSTGPYFFSSDNGSNWALNSVIPGGTPIFGTKDISIRFGSSGVLYAGIIRGDSEGEEIRMNILRKTNFSGPGLMTILVDRAGVDQPWVEATTHEGKDIVYISSNDFGSEMSGRTASVDISLDAANSPPPAGFTSTARLESRTTAGQNGPSVRTAIHSSGVIYCAFLGWRIFQPNVKSDIVVVRDDNWASGPSKFQDLTDPTDGKAGQRVVTKVPIAPLGRRLGTQRVGSSLTIAVDPTDSRRIYIAWCDGLASSSSPYTLHVRRSDDSGQNWTGDLFSVVNTTNPGLAVNTNGVVGLLYQELVNTNGADRWRTHFVNSADHFTNVPADTILADVLDSNESATTTVIIGDYSNLISVRNDFYGVFSAYNEPDLANFPVGVTYLRNHDFNTKRLLNVNNSMVVRASVDPYFVHCKMD